MTLHVTTTGTADGPTVVLLHGLGVSSWMWDAQVAALADGFRCVTVDLPGSGASSGTPWESTSATAAAVAEVVADVADDGAAHVVGLSLGGYVGLALLAEHPDRVRSAVLSGITAAPLTPAWFWGATLRATLALLRVPAFVRANAAMMQLADEQRTAFVADAARMDRPSARRISAELLHHRVPPLGPHAERLLVVAGDGEARAIREGLAAFAATGATAAVVPRAHHAWSGEHPDLFSRTVRCWTLEGALPPELQPVPAPPGALHRS